MGDEKGMVTAAEVARRAGVSRSAVSRTFTPGTSVSPQTRERVMAAAAELGYQVNIIARTMIKGSSNFVGVITAGFENPFRARMLAPIAHHLSVHGLMPLLMNADDPEQLEHSLQQLLSYQVSGVILTSASPPLSLAKQYLQRQIPVAMINRDNELPGADVICSDNRQGGRLAAQVLQKSGVQRPAFVGQGEHNYSSRERRLGFCAEWQHFSRPPIICHSERAGYQGGVEAALSLFAHGERPDGIFCATDMLAFGVMDTLRYRFEISVPQQVCVVGFDDIPQSAQLAYNLTTLSQQSEILAQRAVQALQRRQLDFNSPPALDLVPVSLVIRGSTR